MDCPHCLEYIDFQNKKYSSFTGGTSYYSEVKFFTIKKDGEYKKTETGEFILKEYNSPLEIEESKLEEYVKVSLPGAKYEKIEKSYRKVRVNTLIRQEIGIINNITKVLFEGIPNLDFFPIDLKERHKGFFGLLRLYGDLKKYNIDAVADLHNVLRSKVVRNLFAISGKRTVATDKGRADKKALTRAENKVFEPVKSMFERHCDTFQKLGFPIDLSQPVFP